MLIIRRNIILLTTAIIAVCTLMLSACSNDHCKEQMYTAMQIDFSALADTNAVVALSNIAVSSDKAMGFIYSDTLPATTIKLQLNHLDSISKFNFKFSFDNVNYTKTLVVKHKNTEEFISAECGCKVTSEIDTIYLEKNFSSDSIVLKNKYILGKNNEKNVKIYWNFN